MLELDLCRGYVAQINGFCRTTVVFFWAGGKSVAQIKWFCRKMLDLVFLEGQGHRLNGVCRKRLDLDFLEGP